MRVTRAAALYPGCDVSGPFEHMLQAKMSIHYNVAAALRARRLRRAELRAAAKPGRAARSPRRTRLEIDDELTKAFPAKQGAGSDRADARGRRAARARRRTSCRRRRRRARAFRAPPPARFSALRAPRASRELVDGLERVADAAELSRATRLGLAAESGASRRSYGAPRVRNARRLRERILRRRPCGVRARRAAGQRKRPAQHRERAKRGVDATKDAT